METFSEPFSSVKRLDIFCVFTAASPSGVDRRKANTEGKPEDPPTFGISQLGASPRFQLCVFAQPSGLRSCSCHLQAVGTWTNDLTSWNQFLFGQLEVLTVSVSQSCCFEFAHNSTSYGAWYQLLTTHHPSHIIIIFIFILKNTHPFSPPLRMTGWQIRTHHPPLALMWWLTPHCPSLPTLTWAPTS